MVIKGKIIAILTAIFSKEISVIFIASLPVFELRAAIPIGILKFHLPLIKVYLLSILGNLLPVIPLLLLFKYSFHRLENIKIIGKFFRWWFSNARKRSMVVEKWGFLGLVCFVSIPLPITGAWTGTVVATLLDMKIRKSFAGIATGVLIAGIIVIILSVLGKIGLEAIR